MSTNVEWTFIGTSRVVGTTYRNCSQNLNYSLLQTRMHTHRELLLLLKLLSRRELCRSTTNNQLNIQSVRPEIEYLGKHLNISLTDWPLFLAFLLGH